MLIHPPTLALRKGSPTLEAFEALLNRTDLLNELAKTARLSSHMERRVKKQSLLIEIWKVFQSWGLDLQPTNIRGGTIPNQTAHKIWLQLLSSVYQKFRRSNRLKPAPDPNPVLLVGPPPPKSPPSTAPPVPTVTARQEPKNSPEKESISKSRQQLLRQLTLDGSIANPTVYHQKHAPKKQAPAKNLWEYPRPANNKIHALTTNNQQTIAPSQHCFQIGKMVRVYIHEEASPQTKRYLALQATGDFSPEKMLEREKKFGSNCYNRTLEDVTKELDPNQWPSGTKIYQSQDWYQYEMNMATEAKKTQVEGELASLRKLSSELDKQHQITSVRSQWLSAFTAFCDQSNPDKPYKGCGKCSGCWTRFAQAVCLIKGAAGVADKVIVLLWGAVFRSPNYGNFSFKDWASISIEEYASICARASKAASNAYFVVPMLQQILKNNRLPLTPAELCRFYGFHLKSASLILAAVTGRNHGIPVDRHLRRCFRSLGWIEWQTEDLTKIAITMQGILKRKYWSEVNDILAGLGQLLVDNKVIAKGHILDTAKALDKKMGKSRNDWIKVLPLVNKIIKSLPSGSGTIYNN